ncbi:MAG: DUF58 domain-containing protein [Acidobacteriaceae bacterium]|nr:DUF58 domain-containing protein [Acidobacteriaceae bacterium]MBV9038538.1 DUF58 domain-containing protein [Acidobacteriaceae bacterium]MBV9226477.1 DUF58 domain-containing protein [Acidobacteriaceae bacterium]MBV9307025.1 DUF58 domain-containing protein [Acidobacteriaceae bacterium]MBV9938078.1 DUF58 domain-containing protein [Acidobacteriaceae bacterium]
MPEPLIDRHFLERLERLTLQWQKSFPGRVGGHNLSHFAGSGQEFLDHRSFHQGDDLRAVNWRAYMRFEKLFLKMFQLEPRVPVRLLIDISASMTSGSPPGDLTKFDYARKLAAALVYVGLVRLDSILLQPFSGRLFDPFLCSGGRHRFQPAENFLRSLTPGGQTHYLDVLRLFLNAYPQRGLVIIISDFLDDADCLHPLQYLADFGHELLLIQLWGEEDREPSDRGELELIDAETGAGMKVAVDDGAREEYKLAFDEHAGELRKLALRNGGRYAGLSTRIPIEEAMFGPMTTAGSNR